jgi:ABC-type glutathione transport system ATPase component
MNAAGAAAALASSAPAPALEFRGVGAHSHGRWIVRDISFALAPGETLALLGPSGAGKSTVARLAVGEIPAAEGQVLVSGRDLAQLPPPELRRLRPRMPLIYQDPQRSLDPTQTVAAIIAEGLELVPMPGARPPGWPGSRRRQRWRMGLASQWLQRVGLDPAIAGRLPRGLSGGQRQRVAIARACAVQPTLLVADEPAAALDVATGARVLALLARMQLESAMACLLVSHHLAQVAGLAQSIGVLDAGEGDCGRMVEIGPAAQVLAAPRHPVTQALIEATLPWPI